MDILDVLDNLEDGIEKSVMLPFSSKSLVDKAELLEILKEVRLSLPDDIKQAEWIKQEESRIIEEAKREAEKIIAGAEEHIKELIDENEITKKAYEHASEIIESAQKNAREIKNGTKQYADKILLKVENALKDTLKVVKENRNELKETSNKINPLS